MKIITEHQSIIVDKLHSPDLALMETFEALEKCKEMAKTTTENPRSIIKKSQLNSNFQKNPKQFQNMNFHFLWFFQSIFSAGVFLVDAPRFFSGLPALF
jgi:hypothetical protein